MSSQQPSTIKDDVSSKIQSQHHLNQQKAKDLLQSAVPLLHLLVGRTGEVTEPLPGNIQANLGVQNGLDAQNGLGSQTTLGSQTGIGAQMTPVDPLVQPIDDAKGSRRPVSNTRRAAQNRSAQKAFRQRKERYIKDLEAQAAEVPQLKQTIEDLKAENLKLRDYTIALQGRFIELGPDNFNPTANSTNAVQSRLTDNPAVYNKIMESRQ